MNFNTFTQWCQQQENLEPSVSATIDAILRSAYTNDWEQAIEFIENSTDLHIFCDYDDEDVAFLDLQPLGSLTQLTSLYISGHKIFDLSPLSNLINLKSLHISSDSMSDLTPLANLTNLTRLGIDGWKVTDISPLKPLINLRHISLDGCNSLTKLSPLACLGKLKTFSFLKTRGEKLILDLSPLSYFKNLHFLEISGHEINDLSPLSDLIKLEYMYLNDNEITDNYSSKKSLRI